MADENDEDEDNESPAVINGAGQNTSDQQQNPNSKADAYKAKLHEVKGDTIIKRKKIQLFKFWPKQLLRQGWLKYVSAASETGENVNAAFLAILVLDKVTQQFVLNCIEKQHKKQIKVGYKIDSIERMRAGLTNYKMTDGGGMQKSSSGRNVRGAAQTNRYNK